MKKLLFALLFVFSCVSHEIVDPTEYASVGESCVTLGCEDGLSCNDRTNTCSAPCHSGGECDAYLGAWGNCWLFDVDSNVGECLPECGHDATVCGEYCSCQWIGSFPPRYGCVCE